MQRSHRPRTANTTTTTCHQKKTETLRWAPLKMTLTMNILFLLISTGNTWGEQKTLVQLTRILHELNTFPIFFE